MRAAHVFQIILSFYCLMKSDEILFEVTNLVLIYVEESTVVGVRGVGSLVNLASNKQKSLAFTYFLVEVSPLKNTHTHTLSHTNTFLNSLISLISNDEMTTN